MKILAMVLASILMASNAYADVIAVLFYSDMFNRPNMSNADKDKFLANAGDILSIKPVDWTFGTKELIPPDQGGHLVRVRVNGITLEEAQQYVQPDLVDPEDPATIRTNRRWYVKVRTLSQPIQRQIEETGYYEVDWNVIKGFFEDKVTGQPPQ